MSVRCRNLEDGSVGCWALGVRKVMEARRGSEEEYAAHWLGKRIGVMRWELRLVLTWSARVARGTGRIVAGGGEGRG